MILGTTPACFSAFTRAMPSVTAMVVYTVSAPDCLIWSTTAPNSVVPGGMSVVL